VARALDAHGAPLKVGDMVRAREIWSSEPRAVLAIGTYSLFAGYLSVTGISGWVSAKRFEKCKAGEE